MVAPRRCGHASAVMNAPPSPELLEDLLDWISIPSISTGEGSDEHLHAAAEWARVRIERVGGDARLIESGPGRGPLVVGELRSASPDARTVLAYGHYDVQGPGDVGAWTSDPFQPVIRLPTTRRQTVSHRRTRTVAMEAR